MCTCVHVCVHVCMCVCVVCDVVCVVCVRGCEVCVVIDVDFLQWALHTNTPTHTHLQV